MQTEMESLARSPAPTRGNLIGSVGFGLGRLDSNALRLLFAVYILLLVSSILSDDSWQDSSRLAWFVGGGLALASILAFKQVRKLDLLSAPIVYMGIFWMFHFGLVFPAAVVPELLDSFPSWSIAWVYSPDTTLAILLSLVFLACFSFGLLLIPSAKRLSLAQMGTEPSLIFVGWLAIGVGLVLHVVGIGEFGLSVFLKSYQDYFTVHNTFSYSVIAIAYGLSLQAAGGRSLSKVIVTTAAIYVPLALLSMLAGARTAPLFSGTVLLIVLAKRGLKISRLRLWLAILITLAFIATIRDAREYGLGDLLASRVQVGIGNPLSALTEMGASLRPVTATIEYMRSQDYFYGETFIFPVVRQISPFIGLDKGSPLTDLRFIAARIADVYGAIGYSPVAEAYANGSVWGVIIFSLLWGICFGVLHRNSAGPYGLAVFAGVLIPMMTNIRNSFVYVPAWIFLALVPILFAKTLRRGVERAARKRRSLCVF